MSNPLIVHHGECPDGFTAAWIAYRALERRGVTPELYPAKYEREPQLPEVGLGGRDVYVLDFSYPPNLMDALCDLARSVVLLDHHQTAQDQLDKFDAPNLAKTIDMDRSGAMLAFDYFREVGDEDPPAFVLAVQDRDLWRFALPHTAEIMATVTSYPYTLEAWDSLAATHPDKLVSEGAAINRYREQLIDLSVRQARRTTIAGHDVPVVNTIYAIASDVAGRLAVGEPFAAYYVDGPTDRSWGLRSAPEGLDVAEIAEQLGGGGHRHASGFRTTSDALS